MFLSLTFLPPSIQVPIIARKESPQLNLPSILDCQSCWLGDKYEVVFRISNRGGDAGFKFFAEGGDDQREDGLDFNSDMLSIGCFTLTPSEFFIQKNDSVEITAVFTPKKEGFITERIVLACDNLTSSTYTL